MRNLCFSSYTIKIFIFFSLIIGSLSGCEKEEKKWDNNETIDPPELIVSPENLILSQHGEGTLYISTQPGIQSNFLISSTSLWLEFTPSQGEVNNNIVEVKVQANIDEIEEGDYSGIFNVVSNNAISKQISVHFNFDPNYSSIISNPDSVVFDYFDNENTFYLKNNGLIDANWELQNMASYLEMNPISGFLTPGDSILLNIEVDRTGLSSDIHFSQIEIKSDTYSFLIPVKCYNYVEEKWLFTGQVRDAVFHRESENITLAMGEPAGVKVLKTETQEEHFIPVANSPKCVSVNVAGNKAVAAADNVIYHLSLENLLVLDSWTTNFEPIEIIYGPGGWAYVIYYKDDWGYIFNLNLNTGEMYTFQVGWDKPYMDVQLHPSNESLYVMHNTGWNNVTDFWKYSLANDTTEFLYKKTSALASAGKKFWISDDGIKMITERKKVAGLSTNQLYDISYIGEFDSPSYDQQFYSTSIHSASNKVAAVLSNESYPYEPLKECALYNYNTLMVQDVLRFPDYIINMDTTIAMFESIGKYVFFDSTGEKIHLILKAEDNYPLMDDWSVFTYHLNKN